MSAAELVSSAGKRFTALQDAEKYPDVPDERLAAYNQFQNVLAHFAEALTEL